MPLHLRALFTFDILGFAWKENETKKRTKFQSSLGFWRWILIQLLNSNEYVNTLKLDYKRFRRNQQDQSRTTRTSEILVRCFITQKAQQVRLPGNAVRLILLPQPPYTPGALHHG